MSQTALSMSIVSHGHCAIVRRLLLALTESRHPLEIILTINDPALESADWIESLYAMPRLKVIINLSQQGFASNHNRAAKIAIGDYFCVLNPDISLANGLVAGDAWADVLGILQEHLNAPDAGLAYPTQTDLAGNPQDSERKLVTPWQIVQRHTIASKRLRAASVDWVNGACMMFRKETFITLGGFDERYRMYCEDVDICLRLQLAGYKLVKAPCYVVHDTQRQTLKNWQHLSWHVKSLSRLWLSSVFWRYQRVKIRF